MLKESYNQLMTWEELDDRFLEGYDKNINYTRLPEKLEFHETSLSFGHQKGGLIDEDSSNKEK